MPRDDAPRYSRFVKIRGRWVVMNVNVEQDQANRHGPETEWGEEASVYVANRAAAHAQELLVAAKAVADYCNRPVDDSLRKSSLARLQIAIGKVEGDDG